MTHFNSRIGFKIKGKSILGGQKIVMRKSHWKLKDTYEFGRKRRNKVPPLWSKGTA